MIWPPLEIVILLVAPLVLVPLGLRLIACRRIYEPEANGLRRAPWLCSVPALLLALSFLLQRGIAAAALATPWLVFTLVTASVGVRIAWRNGFRINRDSAIAAALLFLPVGAGWAAISRAGMRPQNFSDEIVLLTAVHFHYAGFVLPLLAGLAVDERPAGWQRAMLAAIIIGVPAVGVGISLSPHVEVVAAMVLAVACVTLSGLQARRAFQSQSGNAATLLLISSAAILGAMILAGIYAMSEFRGESWVSIRTMIQSHGVLNAFGFALCGLLGHSFSRRSN